ncbi:tetratricopeptide repeat protein [Pedobacter sp.]|nr:tetratricopeptide repeat protein [Candidatus Saccharibacteria bacterium]
MRKNIFRHTFNWRALVPSRKRGYLLYGAVIVVVAIGTVLLIKELNPPAQISNPVADQYRATLPELAKKVKDTPKDANAHKEYAVALYATGDTKKANEQYQAAAKINDKDATTYNNLGNTYRDLGDLDKAVEAYKKASSLNAKLINPYVNLANVQLYSQEKPADAIATYKTALKALPDNNQIRVLLALAYEQSGDINSAKQTYQDVLANDPENAAAKVNVARLSKS